jgi:hypothetical protein
MYQRQMQMYPGMPNMPPNMILGPSGMPYYPGQGGQMPYRAAATTLVLGLGQKLHSSIDTTSARMGKWAADEDSKLKDAVITHGGKNWALIATLVSGRTKKQCYSRWKDFLGPSIDWTTRRRGNWTAVEDRKLTDAVQTHGGKNWCAISALVPGRTRSQCQNRWHSVLNPGIDRTPPERTCDWTVDEDGKLKDAVHTHGGKNWCAIAALVIGRTKSQCYSRWYNALNHSIALAKEAT